MKSNITKRLIDTLVGEQRDRDLIVFDASLPGFVLKITPKGRASFQIRYRVGGRGSPLRTHKLGDFGPLTPDAARKMAQALLGDVRRGIDPAAAKAQRVAEDRNAVTVASLAETFLEIHGATKLKPKSLVSYRRAFHMYANPKIGSVPVKDVTYGDIEKLHHGLRETPATANRTVATLSKFFSWAIRAGYRPDRVNPCRGLERYREQGRERFLNVAEITALGRAIASCEAADEITVWQAALFRCLMLTGMRRDELRTLTWPSVDVDRAVFRLDDSKVGRRAIPVPAPVLDILNGLPRVAGNPYVFVGHRPGAALVNVAKPWARVLEVAGMQALRIHDLRHTAASVAIAAGASLPQVGAVLGHASEATTKRYSHIADDATRALSDQIASTVARAMGTNGLKS